MANEESVEYIVQPGDCLFSIAEDHGYHWETIWKDWANAALRQLRKTPSVLMAGDLVILPRKKTKELSRPTDQTHKFVRRGTPAQLRLQFLSDGEPRKNQPYTIDLDGITRSGTTDGEGFLSEFLPPMARRGILIFGSGGDQHTYAIELGDLDPINTDSGIAKRLSNLGFLPQLADHTDAGTIAVGLGRLQATHNFDVSGRPDPETIAKLKELHGS